MYLQPVRTPAKVAAPRKLSPLLSNVRFEEEEKRLDAPDDQEEALFFQMKPNGGAPVSFHLTPNYQRLSRGNSPKESQEIMSQDYFFGDSIVSPFRTVSKQLYRANYAPDPEDSTRKFF